jgi:hypothetical protein
MVAAGAIYGHSFIIGARHIRALFNELDMGRALYSGHEEGFLA